MRQAIELSRAYRGTTLLLSDVLEVDDEYTGFHSRSVVSLSVAVADAMGLGSSAAPQRRVRRAAPRRRQDRRARRRSSTSRARSTDDEWLVIKTHTIEGQRMLDRVGGLLSEVGRIVRSSHEKWDGSGYPDGLAGDEIPVESAIVSCCDAFNAMTTDRSYRAAMSLDEAIGGAPGQCGQPVQPGRGRRPHAGARADPSPPAARRGARPVVERPRRSPRLAKAAGSPL